MEWSELREKHKQLLLNWHEFRAKIELMDKIVLDCTIEPGKELRTIPNDV